MDNLGNFFCLENRDGRKLNPMLSKAFCSCNKHEMKTSRGKQEIFQVVTGATGTAHQCSTLMTSLPVTKAHGGVTVPPFYRRGNGVS